jgi:hypothetical protein
MSRILRMCFDYFVFFMDKCRFQVYSNSTGFILYILFIPVNSGFEVFSVSLRLCGKNPGFPNNHVFR